MRVLVCGGRTFSDAKKMAMVLDELHSSKTIAVVIYGAARGADTLAKMWAETRNVKTEGYPADWDRYGKAAGPMRNMEMLLKGKPDLVVAFPGAYGTADMVNQAKQQGVPVKEIR